MNREEKSNKHFTWFMLILALVFMIVLLFLGTKAYGQSQNNYGIADFSRRDAYPKDGLVADFNFLTAQTEGDILQGQGDMEHWSVGFFGLCPDGFSCITYGTGTFTQEVSKIYKSNSSTKITIDGMGMVTVLSAPMDYAANAYYQISFFYKGEAGGEIIECLAHDAGVLDFYSFPTQAWGGTAYVTFTATTGWQRANLYMNVGAVAKTGYFFSCGQVSMSAPSVVFYLDNMQIQKLKHSGPYSGPSNVTMTVNGDPSFDSQNAKNSFKGQPGNWGTSFNGTTDYLTYPDTGDTFDPCSTGKTCQMTIACNGMPLSGAGTHLFFSKFKLAGSQISWDLRQDTSDINFAISDDGTANVGHFTLINKTGIGVGTLFNTIGTYYPIADGTSLMYVYLNNLAVSSTAIADYPIFNSTTDMYIGSSASTFAFNGNLYHCSYYNKYFDSIDASKWINPYFPANNNNRGFYVSTCTQAASHATCSWDTCRDGTPHACQAEETGSMAVFDTKTEKIPYNSFETIVGDDSDPTITGWSKTVSAGDGTASITAYRDSTQHGNVAIRMKTTGTTSSAMVGSNCISVSPSTDYYFEVYGKTLSKGSCHGLYCSLTNIGYFHKYTDGACSNDNGWTMGAINTDMDNVYRPYGVKVNTDVGTNSIQLYYTNYHYDADVLLDSFSMKAGSYRTPFVHNSGAGTTSYNTRTYQVHNTLTDAKPDGTYPWATGWCMSAWIYSDWAGDDGADHGIIEVHPTAGNNNWIALAKNSANEVTFNIYDSAGVRTNIWLGTRNNTNWTAGGWKYFEGCSNNSSMSMMHYYNANNSTWYTSGITGAPVQDGQSNYVRVGFANFSFKSLDGYISNICFAPYSASYSACNWNNGNPPKRPY